MTEPRTAVARPIPRQPTRPVGRSESPRVSVLLSVHNGSQTLADAVESILGQTFRDFELLAFDDGSTDGSPGILQKFSQEDERVHFVRNGTNLGLTRTLNTALDLARGSYVARQDADDISYPSRLQREVEFLDQHSDVGLVGTGGVLLDPRGGTQRIRPAATDHYPLSWTLLFQNCFIHSSVMARRDVLRAAGGYDERFRYGQDYELWARLRATTRLAQIDEPLVRLRAGPFGGPKFEETGKTVRHVVRRSLREMFGSPPDDAVVEGLVQLGRQRPLRAGKDVGRLADLILEMHKRFLEANDLPADQRGHVRTDAARRIRTLARANSVRHPLAALATFRKISRLSPN